MITTTSGRILKRLTAPRLWSIKTRFFITTGFLLLFGAIFTFFIVARTIQLGTEQNVSNRLHDFNVLLKKQQKQTLHSLMISASIIGTSEKITQAIQVDNQDFIHFHISKYLNAIRSSTGDKTPLLRLYSNDLSLLFNTESFASTEAPSAIPRSLVKVAQNLSKPVSGIQHSNEGPMFTAVFPVNGDNKPVGFVEMSLSYASFFRELDMHSGYGAAIVIHDLDDQQNPQSAVPNTLNAHSQDNAEIMQFGTTDIEGLIIQHDRSDADITFLGDLVAYTQPLEDFQHTRIGDIILFYDSKLELNALHQTMNLMGWLTGIGVLLIMVSLYLNLRHVSAFAYGLKLAIMSSQSGNYRAPYISGLTRCTSVLKCDNQECRKSHDQNQICYLVNGDRAIPPKTRGTCLHLREYKRCKDCPVYAVRKGDELTELRHGFNTVMHLWQSFLDTAGKRLNGNFGLSEPSHPSLDDLSGYLKQMAELTNFSHDLQGVYSKDEVYRQLEWIFGYRFNLDVFTLLEVNSSENRMESVVSQDEIGESHLEVFFDCELCRAKRMAEEVTSEVNPHLCPYFGIDHEQEIRCCIPMVMGGRVGAVFTFRVKRADWEEHKTSLPIIKQYLEEAAPILSSLRLLQKSKEQALKDPLTLCHNRRFMDEYLVQIERLNNRSPRKVGFIMADLDHFKMVNDQYGHLAGDDILRQLAEIFRANIRKSDLLIRYGGEEFLIILMEIDEDEVSVKIAEKLRLAVESAQLSLPSGNTLYKTVSLGVSEFPADAGQLYKSIKYADVALYQAKEQGRNRVVRFTSDLWHDEKY